MSWHPETWFKILLFLLPSTFAYAVTFNTGLFCLHLFPLFPSPLNSQPPPPPLHSMSQFKSYCKCLLLKSCCRAKIFCWHALVEPWRLQEHVLTVISFFLACICTSPLDLSDLDLTMRAAVVFLSSSFFPKTMNNAAQSPLRSINYGSWWRDTMTLRPVDKSVIISRTISSVTHACTKRLHIHASVFFSCPYFLILPFTRTPTALLHSHNGISNSRCNCIQHEGQSPITWAV